MTQWKQLLKTLGFTESEAGIYLTSLEMGPASVQDIAKKAHVSRVTTYAVIESLAERGLLSSVEKGKKRLFVAESPDRLVSFVSHRVREMETTLKEIESSLHDLKLMQRGEKPVVKLFEGEEALRAIHDDIGRVMPTHLDEFGNLDEVRKHFKKEHVRQAASPHLTSRVKRRAIYITKDHQALGPDDELNQRAVVDPLHATAKGDVIVYGNKVAMSSVSGKVMSVLIESEEIAHTMRDLISLAWKAAKG